MMRVLLDYGAEPNLKGENEWNCMPLHLAMSRCSLKRIELLLDSEGN